MAETKEHLKREIGIFGLSTNIINTIIGAGIFALPALVAAGLGPASIFAYLFCGVLMALIMLCFAEVASKITTSGGTYTYIETTFGPYWGFITIIIFVLAAVASDAAVANALTNITESVFPFFNTKFLRIIFLLVIFGGLAIINVKGVKEGITLVKLITAAKLIPLLILVFFSWGKVSPGNIIIDAFPPMSDIGKTSLVLFFSFLGAESGLSVSGEVINPQKTIPKAIFISITVILILYILIQTVSQGVLGDTLKDYTDNPLGIVAKKALGPIGFTIMTVGAANSMFGNLSSEVLGLPRMIFRASVDNVLPFKSLSRIHKKFATPYVAVIVYAAIGFLFALIGGFEKLIILASETALLLYLGVSLSVIKLRRTGNSDSGTFNIPGGYTVPILSSFAILWFLFHFPGMDFLWIVLFIMALTVIYFLRKQAELRNANKRA